MSQIWETSGIYHSHLTQRQREHPDGLVCQIVSDAIDSKWKEGVRVQRLIPYGYDLEDEKAGHWLTLESEAVEAEMASAPQKEWVVIVAEGTRDSATIRWTAPDLEHGFIPDEEVATPVTATKAEPKPEPTPKKANPVAKTVPTETSNGVDNDFVDSLLRAHNIAQRYKEITGVELDENVRTLATNLRMGTGR
mgnify:CR=1 FL=1|jgi:hypothetical protein